MSEVYNYLRDGGMIIRIKPTVTNCNTLKVFPTFDVGLKHLLTVANGTGTGRYTGNEIINIIANAVTNYYFNHWTDPSSVVTDVNSGTTTVTMPFLDCTVTATFLPYRALTVNNGSGSNSLLKPGDVRQIIANTPTDGYIFDNWSGDTAYLSANTETANIIMPDANIVLTANYLYTRLGYGALYNWYAASNANFAPAGWHLPTLTNSTTGDYPVLTTYLGGESMAGGHLKEAGLVHWLTPNTNADNSSGFNGLGSGFRSNNDGTFSSLKNLFQFWLYYTTSPTVSIGATPGISNSGASTYGASNKKYGMSVRLIKDDSTNPGTMTDYDGNVYNCVTIGSQVWTASNWKCTKLNDGTAIANVTDNAAWAALIDMGYCWYGNDINNS